MSQRKILNGLNICYDLSDEMHHPTTSPKTFFELQIICNSFSPDSKHSLEHVLTNETQQDVFTDLIANNSSGQCTDPDYIKNKYSNAVFQKFGEKDFQIMLTILRNLKKEGPLYETILANVRNNGIKTNNLSQKDLVRVFNQFLQNAGILPALQFLIIDCITTGGASWGSEQTYLEKNPFESIKTIAELVKDTVYNWEDFFPSLLRKPILMLTLDQDNPELALIILFKNNFDYTDLNKKQPALSNFSIYEYAEKNKKKKLCSRIEKDIENLPMFASLPDGYGRTGTEVSPIIEANLHLGVAVAEIISQAISYLKTYPEPTKNFLKNLFSKKHLNQKQCQELIKISYEFLDSLNQNYKSLAAYNKFMTDYQKILSSLNKDELYEALTSSQIEADISLSEKFLASPR